MYGFKFSDLFSELRPNHPNFFYLYLAGIIQRNQRLPPHTAKSGPLLAGDLAGRACECPFCAFEAFLTNYMFLLAYDYDMISRLADLLGTDTAAKDRKFPYLFASDHKYDDVLGLWLS